MKYVALLRGINVGGNNIIKMADLKSCFEKKGFINVLTFIQSGNVIFESPEQDVEKLTHTIEHLLSNTFNYNSRIVLRSHTQMKKILEEIPSDWKKRTDIRCNVAFIKEPLTVSDAVTQIKIKEEVDFMKAGPGVIYMATLLTGLTKSGFVKMIGTKVYKEMTIRNFNTTQKLLLLMDS